MVVRVVRVMRFAWIAGIALALLALVVIGIGIAQVLVTAQTRLGSGNASPSAHMLGTSARLGSMVATVTAVRILPIDLGHRPAANHEFVAISVRLVNVNQVAEDYGVSDFALRDQAGDTVNPDIGGSALIGTAALPNKGTIAPGGGTAGEIVFEVPMSNHAAMLLWQPTAAPDDGTAAWRLVL